MDLVHFLTLLNNQRPLQIIDRYKVNKVNDWMGINISGVFKQMEEKEKKMVNKYKLRSLRDKSS